MNTIKTDRQLAQEALIKSTKINAIENFIIYYTSNEKERKKMREVAIEFFTYEEMED